MSVQIRVRPIDDGLPYLAHGCITMRRCVAYIHYLNTTLNFDLMVKFKGFLTWCRVRLIIFLILHWLTIFGTCAYHNGRICCIQSLFRSDIHLWPQCQIYRFLSYLCAQPVTSVCFDIGIPTLTHVFITTRGCVAFIHDPDMTLIFDLKVKFIGFITWLCVRAIAFLSIDIVILCFARECITMVQCVLYIHDLCMTLTYDLNTKIIFSPWIWVGQDRLCSLT